MNQVLKIMDALQTLDLRSWGKMNLKMLSLTLIVLWLPLTIESLLAQANSPIQYWAIVSDPNVRKSGLEDLLFAELANANIELVERSDLEAVAKEFSTQAIASGKPGERIRVGKLLHADALIILEDSTGSTKVTICECRWGVRLASLNFKLNNLEADIGQLTAAILEVRQRFSLGIQLVIGISPFVCRNIQHDFDHLQLQYLGFLSSSVQLSQGVALIEVEEAHSLSQEFSAGIDAEDRVVPLFVEADYVVDDTTSPPTVQIEVKLTSGTQVEQVRSSAISLDRAGPWISTELTREIIARSTRQSQLLGIAEQRDILRRRAEQFRRMGDAAHAIQCREALLLIDALNSDQRLQLISEIQGMPFENMEHLATGYSRARSEARIAEQTRRMLLVNDHFRFLVENRLIDRAQAIERLLQMSSATSDGIVDGAVNGPAAMMVYHFASANTKPILDAILATNRKFVLQVAPKILQLKAPDPLTAENDIREQVKWQQCVMRRVCRDVYLHGATIESLEFLEQVVREIIPAELPTSWEVARLLIDCRENRRLVVTRPSEDHSFVVQRNEATFGPNLADYQAYLNRISRSRHPHLQLYGKFGLHQLETSQSTDSLATERRSHLVGEITAMIEERPWSQLRDQSGMLLDPTASLADQHRRAQHPPPPVVTPAVQEKSTSLGRLQFEPLDFNFESFDTEHLEWINCHDKFDVLADSQHVAVMHSPGELKTIISAPALNAGPISHCKWDGKHLWLTHTGGDIGVYDTAGNLIAKVDRTVGLPVHDRDLQIFPVQADKAIAYGQHGSDRRSWLALIELRAGQPDVRLFFEARQSYEPRRVYTNEQIISMQREIGLVFKPSWFGVCGDGDRHIAYLGRAQSAYPLAIDLNTLNVQLSEVFGRSSHLPPGRTFTNSMVSAGTHVYKAHRTGVLHLEFRPSATEPTTVSENFISSFELARTLDPSAPARSVPTWYDDQPTLLPFDQWVYKPGEVWFRFHPLTCETERLVPTGLPRELATLKHSVSSHFGVVGWSLNLGKSGKKAFFKIAIN